MFDNRDTGNTIKSFQLKILSPNKKYFDGEAISVSATNQHGPFDVLAEHTNFFSLLSPGVMVVKTSGGDLPITMKTGIIKVANHQVIAFVNI
jgi:F-type H+-transporting ATPase subunit epsilon